MPAVKKHKPKADSKPAKNSAKKAASGKENTTAKTSSSVTKAIKAPKTMEDLLGKSERKVQSFTYGQLVEGVVVAKGKNELLLDVGGKSEGIISGQGIPDDKDTFRKAAVGDSITAMVTQSENDQGYLVLSLRRAVPMRRWKEMYRAFEAGDIVEVKVLDYHKGGLLVDAIPYSDNFYLRGFVPLSHLDPSKAPDRTSNVARGSSVDIRNQLQGLIGQNLRVKIIEIDKSRNRLVFSEKDALQEEFRGVRDRIMSKLQPGDTFSAVITGIMPFGLFARLQDDEGNYLGLDGLVHISEISWTKEANPLQVYKVGDSVRVSILNTHGEGNKLALSIKATRENPWDKVEELYSVGASVKGRVTKIMEFGAFVHLPSGVDGLIHVSETTGPLEIGQEVVARIINLDAKSRRLGLSLRSVDSEGDSSEEKPSGKSGQDKS